VVEVELLLEVEVLLVVLETGFGVQFTVGFGYQLVVAVSLSLLAVLENLENLLILMHL
jgi:hypothetical protein